MKPSPRMILAVSCLFAAAMGCVSAAQNGGTGGAPNGAGGGRGGTAGGGAGAPGGVGGMGGVSTGTGGVVGATGGGPGGAVGTGGTGAGGAPAGIGGASSAYTCPTGPFTGTPIPTGATATRIAGAPPTDAFNLNMFTNVEGPVWIGDSLYFSEMKNTDLPPARILKITSADVVSVFVADSGSNGLAVDNDGNIVSANHGAQGIVRFTVPGMVKTTLVSTYNGTKFNSPNDLTVKRDGTIFFTDPKYQNGSGQLSTAVYQLLPGASVATLIAPDYTNQNPNGISLSLDEQTLYVGGGSGVKTYPITGGTVGVTGTRLALTDVANANTDGMVFDCAGNLYVAVASTTNVVVVKADGASKWGTIQVSGPSAVTNVAFGGTDHKTLYITGQGSSGQQGVFKVTLNFPGMPY